MSFCGLSLLSWIPLPPILILPTIQSPQCVHVCARMHTHVSGHAHACARTHTHTHSDQRVVISIGNEEEGIGIEPHADWLAWGWKANYLLFLTTTSDVMLFAVKALTGCTLNILAICPIRFCSPRLKPFKDSAACHFRADWLPNAHIWNTWFQY